MIPIAAITDEFSQDLDTALDAMKGVGMTGVELRVIGGKNIIEHSDAEIDRIIEAVARRDMRILSIASPVLKCVLPDAPAIDARFQQDIFGSAYTFEDQPRLAKRAMEIATRTGAGIIRVFSYWRTVDPARCFDRIVDALGGLAERAADEGLIIGLENEHACNVATAEETLRVLLSVGHPGLQMIWDPANAFISGETPFPDGYAMLPPNRICHVHAKDCNLEGHTPVWGPLGEMGIDWKGQVRALERDAYEGWISLETHWKGPRGDKFEASVICGKKLAQLVGAK